MSAIGVQHQSPREPVAAAAADSEAVVVAEEETEADSVEVVVVTAEVASEGAVVEDPTGGK